MIEQTKRMNYTKASWPTGKQWLDCKALFTLINRWNFSTESFL